MPTHAEKRLSPYAAEQMFNLVADVARYPEFLPWCVGARIREQRPDFLLADLIIGYKMIRERFTSRVMLDRDNFRITAEYAEGPFKHLVNHWHFIPQADGGCLIDFYVDFELKVSILQKILAVIFGEAVHRMVVAFETRAKKLYGEIPDSTHHLPME